MPLLDGNPHIDEVLEFPRRKFRGAGTLPRVIRWTRELRERVRPDLILDYQGLLRSALISRLCRRKGARVLGLSDAREGSRLFYDSVIDTSRDEHAVDRYLALTFAATGGSRGAWKLEWQLPAGDEPAGFDDASPFLILHPFARGGGKSLTTEQVAEFCASVVPHRVVVIGQAVASLGAIPNAVDLLNRTSLLELIWLLRHAEFNVSVDSGPMHIAAALSGRLISIHTWSDPAKVGPYRRDAWVWKDGKLFTQADRDKRGAWREVCSISALAEFLKTQL